MTQTRTFDEKILQEIIRRVVEVASPEKIILFGSAARGDMGPNSDVDLLVIVDNHLHRRRTAQAIYRRLIGVGFAADIVIVTCADVDKYRDVPGFIIHSAMEEGKLAYAR
jgi:predicted nucleotidyltransferase